ncbi:MAG: AsmA family protein [Terriglobia bacterium]
MKKRRWLILLLLGLGVLALVPLMVGQMGLRGAVVRAFERQWGRSVQLNRVEARLFPEPGLHAYGVRIGEAEAFGAEPFVQAEEVHCRLKLSSLVRGRVECARLHLVRPSLNLVRNRRGGWNLAQWAEGNAGSWPALSAEEARINFKQGAEKKVYALANAHFTWAARRDAWHLNLEAQPFRSDRRLTEAGRIRLTGTLGRIPDETGSLPIELAWDFDRAALSQWFAFATGRELAVRATVSLHGRSAGTWRSLLLAGEFTLEDLRRRDMLPGRAVPRWRGQYEFRFSGPTRTLEIVHAAVGSEHTTIRVRGRIEDLFDPARWDVEVRSPSLALDELLAQYGALKANVSQQARLDGTAQLSAKLTGRPSRWTATLALPEAAQWKVPGVGEPVRVEPVEIRWQRGQLQVRPLRLVFPGERILELRGRLVRWQSVWFARIESHAPELELEHLVAAARSLGWSLWGETQWRGPAQVAVVWRGDLRAWRERRRHGSVELRGVRFHPPAVNQPLQIATARVEFTGRGVRVTPLTLQLGEATVTGTLERTRPDLPWRIRLSVDRLALEEIDALVNPNRARGLLRSLIGSPARSTTAWSAFAAQGHVEVASLTAGPFSLSRLHTDLEWNERRLRLTRLRFRSLGGRFRGSFAGDFRARPPAYRIAGNLKQIDLKQLLRAGTGLGQFFFGSLGADVALQTAGKRPAELRRNLQGSVAVVVTDATLTHINLLGAMRAAAGMLPEGSDAEPKTTLASLAGEFRLANRRVRCEGARLVVDTAALEVSGEVDFAGRLNLRVQGEPLLVADIEPPPTHRQLFTSRFEIRGHLRAPVVRLAAARARR